MLRRNPFLTAEQRKALQSLPVGAPDRAGVIEANLAIARLFLPRARSLAARLDMDWPEAFEAATRRHLRGRLGMSLDEDP